MGQVIAPLLVIQRVADKSALTGDIVVSAHLSEFKARDGGQLTAGSADLPSGDPTFSADGNSGELGAEVESTIDFHRGEV